MSHAINHSAAGEVHGDAQHQHDPHLAHHFDTPVQQFDSGKLGMWVFLNTEILLFGGLFCAYSVYRAIHPEIFQYAHLYLNKVYGGVNTAVLILSSLTMAWAVRCAQLNQRKGLIACLIITLLCALGFLGIKGVEYHDKWREGLLWGTHYEPTAAPEGASTESNVVAENVDRGTTEGVGQIVNQNPIAAAPNMAAGAAGPVPGASATAAAPAVPTTAAAAAPAGGIVSQSAIAPAATGPQGLTAAYVDQERASGEKAEWVGPQPHNVQLFFGIYFIMTGLHGLHVIAGMCVITWILIRSLKGEFSSRYYNPVDFVALYWHIVDIVWIFLFPLLYLIGNR